MVDSLTSFTTYTPEDRSWLVVQPGGVPQGLTKSGTVDRDAFPAPVRATGRILSGTPVTKQEDGTWGPYTAPAADAPRGEHGLLWSDERIDRAKATRAGNAVLVAFAGVNRNHPVLAALTDADLANFPLVYFDVDA